MTDHGIDRHRRRLPSAINLALGRLLLFTGHWEHAIGCGLCCHRKVNFCQMLRGGYARSRHRVAQETLAGFCADP
jgi:hypothetical protein